MPSDVLHRIKESKSRMPVDAWHPEISAAVEVLAISGGGPLSSAAIFKRAKALGFGVNYNSLRARLSQHCDLEDARVVRAAGSKVGVRGARGPGWVLRETGRGIQTTTHNGLMLRVRRADDTPRTRDVVLSDALLGLAPQELRSVAGCTAREALASKPLPAASVRWLLARLPLESELRERLSAARDAQERGEIIAEEERTA